MPGQFLAFLVIWFCLGIGSLVFYQFCHNAQLKRRVHPWWMTFVGVLFLIFMLSEGIPPSALIFMGPAVLLITLLNIKFVRFCDGCGATVRMGNLFRKPHYCPRCGSQLESSA